MEISYKEQVLALLYSALTEYNLNYITREDITKYRLKLTEYFNVYGLKINLNIDLKTIKEFEETFKDIIIVTNNQNSYTYTLKDNINETELKRLLEENVDTFLDVLIKPEITANIFNNKNLSLKKD